VFPLDLLAPDQAPHRARADAAATRRSGWDQLLPISASRAARHRASFDSLARIAHALDLRLIVGFEIVAGGRRQRDLVAI
jgi:hypothetical protein